MTIPIRRIALAALLIGGAGRADAAMIDTVNWVADGTNDGTGTGTLAGGTIAVTFSTVDLGIGDNGITGPQDWNVSLATNGAVMAGVTNMTGGVFGTMVTSQSSISFSSAVTDPIFYANFTDANTSLDFGPLVLTLLDSNNAQLAGSVVSFLGSLKSLDDGFAATINGTFGPGSPIVFIYDTSPGDYESFAFTVGIPVDVAAVPEPSTLASAGIATLIGLGVAWCRRQRAAA